MFWGFEIWVYSISPPSLSLKNALTTEIYCQTEIKTGNTNTHTDKHTDNHRERGGRERKRKREYTI